MKVGPSTIACVEPSRKSAPVPVSAWASKTELQPDADAKAMATHTARYRQTFDTRTPPDGRELFVRLCDPRHVSADSRPATANRSYLTAESDLVDQPFL